MKHMDARLFSDEIRERERRRRRKDMLWNVASFVLHVAFFGAVVMMTPVKSLVFDTEAKKSNPAADLSADRIEEIAASLSQARTGELQRQLAAMQTVLHNMDLMKSELQKDYDAFAEQSSAGLKDELSRMIDEVEQAQATALVEQAPMIGKVEKMVAEERLDLEDEARSKWLREAADDLITNAGDKVGDAQARAGNALDRMQVQAQFGGYRKTAEASGKVRDEQVEAAAMQNKAQKEASEIGFRMGDYRRRANDLKNHEDRLREQKERLAKAEHGHKEAGARLADATAKTAGDARRRIADLEKKVAARKAAVAELDDVRRAKVNGEQIEKLRRAAAAQADVKSRVEQLRKTLAEDSADLRRLVQEDRRENALVHRNASALKLVEAYDAAKEIEEAITESYKDIKATQMAIERKMSFEAAQKITDVAKAVRLKANREAIESSPRTKEALDAQKVAQAEVVREADAIVETVVAMMDEAMALVSPDNPEASTGADAKTIPWLEEKDFAQRAQEASRAERLAGMKAAADYQVAITVAAAENEHERAKDLTKVMEAATADDAKPAGYSQADFGNELVQLGGRMPELVGGNVLRFTENPGKDGIPAKWAYVQDWYVIGPFPNPDRVNLRRKFPPESVVDLDATYVGKGGRTIKWEFMQAKNMTPKETWRGDLKPEVVPLTAEEYGIWYAYAEVFSDVACDRWIAVGSDDRSDIWINDVPVWGSSNTLKAWRVDEGYRRIRLNKGRNRILARIENGWHLLGWSVCISLEDGALAK